LKPSRMLCAPLLFMLLSLVIIALAYSRPNIFAMKNGDSGSDDGNPFNSSDFASTDPEENGLTDNNGEWDPGTFSMHFLQPVTTTVWASDALGNDKELFEPSDSIFASVQAAGQTVTFYVTAHHETWVDGDVLTDVSGGAKMGTLNPSGVQTVEVWVPILVSGCYDVVLDTNNNGLFDLGVDETDVAQVRLVNVIPEVPLGPVVASFGMIAGAAGFAGFKRSMSKRQP
jgi:hypothetical protein